VGHFFPQQFSLDKPPLLTVSTRDQDSPRSKSSPQDSSSEAKSSNAASSEAACSKQEVHSNQKPQRSVYLRPEDKMETLRILHTRSCYKGHSRVLHDRLLRSLLPRIEKGNFSPRRLVLEVAGRRSGSDSREKIDVHHQGWALAEKAARTASRALRHLEEKIVRKGTLQPFPFQPVGPEEILRAAAREITAARKGTPRLFSQELTWGERSSSEKLSGGEPGGGEFSGGKYASEGSSGSVLDGEQTGTVNPATSEAATSEAGSNKEVSSSDGLSRGPSQEMKKLPSQDRGGKQIAFAISEEAIERLKQNAQGWPWKGSVLARRGAKKILRWMEEAPAEAFRFSQKESSLYRPRREGERDGYQFYIPLRMKRRLKRVRQDLQEGLSPGLGRRTTQKEILQGAARLAIEFEEEVRPPPPGTDLPSDQGIPFE